MCIPVLMTLTLVEGFTLVLIMWLQPSLLGTSLLASHGDGPRKGGLNKACLTPTWLASRGQWASLPSCKKNERKKKTANLKVTCWNSHTVENSEDHPQWRSALVARELARLDIDIAVEVAVFSKVRFAEQGFLREDGAGYTLFWSWKNKDENRLSSVSFMTKTSIARKLQNVPVGHSDHIMPL